VTREDEPGKSFFDTLRGAVLSSVPALSALVFVVVAIKVFRASMMETTTTVAIVSTADLVALLKGVILTLLPGFLAGLTAASIWWWAGILPERLDGADAPAAARRGLLSPQAAFAWAMIVTAFFTIWWPIFLLLFLPVLATTVALVRRARARRRQLESYETLPLRTTLRVFGLVGAAVFVGLLTLQPSVWLPLRKITFTGTPPTLKGHVLPEHVAAYVLDGDDDGANLLLNKPRAVIRVASGQIGPNTPFCVPPESRLRFLTLRASQIVRLDSDPHSPYEQCPEIPQRLLGGG
jgi:hypothetical protein